MGEALGMSERWYRISMWDGDKGIRRKSRNAREAFKEARPELVFPDMHGLKVIVVKTGEVVPEDLWR